MSSARIAILISGRGSNMQAFIEACNSGALAAKICLVVSNNPDALGLETAADLGIDTACVNHRDFETREAFDRQLLDTVSQYRADLVILAGFMRILTPVFIEPFQGRLLNVHPSLLPKYPGLNTHQRALDAGDREAGVTVHFVTQELDGGPAIIQSRVAIEENDTVQTLAARVIVQEHRIYPLAAAWFLENRLKLTEQGAVFDGNILHAGGKQY